MALIATIIERTLWHSYAGIQKRLALSCIGARARACSLRNRLGGG